MLQNGCDALRQNVVQRTEFDAGAVRRRDAARLLRRSVGQKIAHELRRRVIISAARAKRRLLQLPLPVHAAERRFFRKILRIQRHKERRVGVFPITRRVRHAVCHKPARLRRGRDDLPAGAHAERVGGAARGQMHIQLVIRRRKPGAARKRAILARIDQALRMLDAHAHGKRLRLHRHTGGVQHLKGVACAVPDGKQHLGAFDHRLHAVLYGPDRGDAPVFRAERSQPRAEAHLAAVVEDLLAEILHDPHQNVGADVRLCVKQDLRAGACLAELLQHPADALVFRAGVELSVRKRTGAALSELDVALRVERAARPERLHLFLPPLRVQAAFEHDGTKPRHRQHQRGKHACGPEAHDHRPHKTRPSPARPWRSAPFSGSCPRVPSPAHRRCK